MKRNRLTYTFWPTDMEKSDNNQQFIQKPSLRSKRFRLVSEQRKAAREMKREQYFPRSLVLVPCSLHLNRTEMLATQAIRNFSFSFLLY